MKVTPVSVFHTMKEKEKINIPQQAVTADMLTSLFENMKDFVRSTIKGNNIVLKKEIKGEIKEEIAPLKSGIKQLQVAVLENHREIKEIRKDMHGMEERLGNKIDKSAIRLDDHETRITTLEEAR